MRWVLYVDMDAFYVSCEIRDRPELEGRAVIVGHHPTDGPSRAVVLSASYEARKFGVHSAQPVGEAAQRCPQAVWIPPDFSSYERISQQVLAWLGSRFDRVRAHSIDEASVSVDVESPERAGVLAGDAQHQLRTELRLPSSWGVATDRTIAKIASDRAKPAGLVVVAPGEAREFLAGLSVRSIPGIGPKTEAEFRRHGITTIGELAASSPDSLRPWLGAGARGLIALARGSPIADPHREEHTGPRSRSKDLTFDEDVRGWPSIDEGIRTLSDELLRTLEVEGWRYRRIGAAFRWGDFSRSQRTRTLPAELEPTAALGELARRLAHELWQERDPRQRAVRTISVRVEALSPRHGKQRSLDPPERATGAADPKGPV